LNDCRNKQAGIARGGTPLTLTKHGLISGANWIGSAVQSVQEKFLNELDEGELRALPYLFDFWVMEHQLPPKGDWRSWVIMGGRGAGKTRAGAEWVRAAVEGARPLDAGRCRRVALVGETIEQVREVMIFGDSGILACSPADRRPDWEATRKRLVWPNGAIATVHSAHDPEGLRGPQFDAAWVDEIAKWKKSQETWDMLQFALRLGDQLQVCITTTPRNVGVLKQLLKSPSTVVTHAPTEANRANLAASFLEEVGARYRGTRLGRQELDGVLLADAEGALWTSEMLEGARGVQCSGPPQDWRAYVLADCTVAGLGPSGWARAAIQAMERFGADRLVAETNQGGQMVQEVIRQVDPLVPYKGVHATRGKIARAEPVAALYEQGRVKHVADLNGLEDQMTRMTGHGYEGGGSPDRVDALHELMIEPAAKWRQPGVRSL
jgi:phage terminase large subunit-like protein